MRCSSRYCGIRAPVKATLMSKLNETVEELFARLIEEGGPKLRGSLCKIKEACDEIELARGVMSYSRVAEVATARFGGPKKQSVQNNHRLKSYIAARSEHYEGKFRNRVQKVDSDDDSSLSKKFPVAGLDMKTRLHITHLEDHVRRLELENRHISDSLQRATRANPLSLADLIAGGPEPDGSLHVEVPNGTPDSVRRLVAALLGKLPGLESVETIAVRRIGEVGEIVCLDHGIERHVIVQRQWVEVSNWLEGLNK
jgi:hypothetical protein